LHSQFRYGTIRNCKVTLGMDDVAGEGLTGNPRHLLFFFQPTNSPMERKRALEHVMMQVLLIEERGYDLFKPI
jgi:hypothetical protein